MDRLAIYHVNLLIALKNNWCTVAQVLDYLLTREVAPETVVLYNNVCLYDRSGEHYVSNGHHFLISSAPIYRAIFLEHKLPWPLTTAKPTVPTLKPKEKVWVTVATGNMTEYELSVENLILSIKCNNVIKNAWLQEIFNTNTLFQAVIEADAFEMISELIQNDPTCHKFVLWFKAIYDRCMMISRINREYFEIIKPEYTSVLTQLIQNHLPNYQQLSDLSTLFDIASITGSGLSIETIPAICKSILELHSLEEQAYVLGIPFHLHDISPMVVLAKLGELAREGKSVYLEKIFEDNDRRLKAIADTEKVNFLETDSVYLEPYSHYNWFDLVPNVYKGSLKLFLRDEARTVKSKSKDKYNNIVSKTIIQELVQRQMCALDCGIGRAEPLDVIFEQLETDKYKSRDKAVDVNQSNSSYLDGIMDLNTLGQGFVANLVNNQRPMTFVTGSNQMSLLNALIREFLQ